MYIRIYIHIPNHCYVPVTVIPKAQMIPVFLWHADNYTGEKINKLNTILRSLQNDNQASASKNQIFKIQMIVTL